MELFGIGIDVVEIARIEASISEFGEKFLDRIFTTAEKVYCEQRKRSVLHYAARFAAKEAVSKALGTGIGKDVSFLEIQVIKKPSGEPEIELLGNAAVFAEKHGIKLLKISITHADHYAAANAIAMKAAR
jgi:holo-[acyl-carrier protein] synthase